MRHVSHSVEVRGVAEGLQRQCGHSLLCKAILGNNPGNLFPQMLTELGPNGVDLETPSRPSPAYPASLPTDRTLLPQWRPQGTNPGESSTSVSTLSTLFHGLGAVTSWSSCSGHPWPVLTIYSDYIQL